MAYSKVGICNIALALLGADSIRDFDEKNKRARMCEVTFEPSRDYLLSKFDWPFARKYAGLNLLDLEDVDIPYGSYGYALPSDIKTPRDIYPQGSRDQWEIIGNILFCEKTEVGLYYTARIDNPTLFSDPFVNLLAVFIAVKIGPAITQDKPLVKELKAQYAAMSLECHESEANIGNTYREYNEDPNNDSFVNPDLADSSLFDSPSRA